MFIRILPLFVIATGLQVNAFAPPSICKCARSESNSRYMYMNTKLFEFVSLNRRDTLNTLSFLSLLTMKPDNAKANLVQFPCKSGLRNTYHIMRTGQNLLEEKNIIETNPMYLTNMEAGLSQQGAQEILNVCDDMTERNINPSVITYSIAAATSDAVSIMASELKVGNNRVIPEYTLMDPRGVGKWNQLSLDEVEPAIWHLDRSEGGSLGRVSIIPHRHFRTNF